MGTQIDLTLKNFRCFPDHRPAKITLGDEFVAFVGSNNVGKSSILKFFHEFRVLFSILADPGSLLAALFRKETGMNLLPPVSDGEELFTVGDRRQQVHAGLFTEKCRQKGPGICQN